jgi:hypothetical protein
MTEISPAQNGVVYNITGDSLMIMSSNNCLPIGLDINTPLPNEVPLTVQFGDDPIAYPLMFNHVYRHPYSRIILTTPFVNDPSTKFYMWHGEGRAFPLVSLHRPPLFYHFYNAGLTIGASATVSLYPQIAATAKYWQPCRTANLSLSVAATPNMDIIYLPQQTDATRLATQFEGTSGSAAVTGTVARNGLVEVGHFIRRIDIKNNVVSAANVVVSIIAEIG